MIAVEFGYNEYYLAYTIKTSPVQCASQLATGTEESPLTLFCDLSRLNSSTTKIDYNP